ncbi:hypothetical protein [Paenalcaligenes suwonensis]|uniref:hypothetical protein n=1 Tax=Paenalcaligenes suwonensis TaxID=1202713 RepID=UPI00140CAAC9|nr:hypothetical protein [Paenalcaligenes suwonensis]NHC62189.1 hypothetical protein [Paenalcaligenes suwonensis]
MARVTTNAKREAAYLARVQKQVPYATSIALNNIAKAAELHVKGLMPNVFDRPTPFTLRSLRLERANKRKLEAKLSFKDFAGKGVAASTYLWPQVHGGGRKKKRFEHSLSQVGPSTYYVPAGGAEQDAYGNMSRGQLVKVLSYLQAFGEQGYRANATPNSMKRTARNVRGKDGYKRINGVVYFISRGKGSMSGNREQHLPAGVYVKSGIHGSTLKMVLRAVDKEPVYAPRLPFYESIEEVYDGAFDREFNSALDLAMKTAK